MRDTIDKHGVIGSPSGTWMAESKRVLILNSWFIEPEGSLDCLKQPVIDWLEENVPEYEFNGYSKYGALLTFQTDVEVLLFRMYWDDQIPK